MGLISKLKKKLYTQRYVVGFLRESELELPVKERFSNIKWMKLGGYKDGWFADPFILSINHEKIILLVEEYLWKTQLGRLSKLTVNARTFKLEKIEPILQLSTHLSFPIYISENDKIYVYPENYQGGALRIFEFDELTNELHSPHVLINEPLLDTQIVKIKDDYYAFGIKYVTGSQSDTKHLKIYKAESLMGSYQLVQEIENPKCQERGAGLIYRDMNGKIMRPAQDCERGYGLATILYRLNFNEDNGTFTEVPVKEIRPDGSKRYGRGLHTFNCVDGLCVVDGRGFRYKISDIIKRYFLK